MSAHDPNANRAKVRYCEADFQKAKKECDLIMKGGITSGVVYPPAILDLATQYRFRSIGGTSAGAIAAAIAAAAERGRLQARQDGQVDKGRGFLKLQQMQDQLTDGDFL